jgi:hypothetical protein
MSEEKQEVELRPPVVVSKQTKDKPDDPKQGPPVDVNSNLTPITRQEVQDVDSLNWNKMSLEQLHDQLVIMENRLLYAQSLGKEEIYKQVLNGVNQLKLIIIEKTPDEIKLL